MRLMFVIVAATVLSTALPEQVSAAAPPVPTYTYNNIHDPDGIGKFFMGREIAHVMGHQGIDWLERPGRVKEERTDKLLKLLPLKTGMTVADVGAGSGFLTFPLAKLVGPRGKVLAVDVQKEMIAELRSRMKKRKVTNVEPILGTVRDPKLPAGGVDLILMVDVYHEFEFPYEMTTAMVKALRPAGKLVFVEYRMEDPQVFIKLVHKMTQKQVKREMACQALKYVKTIDSLPQQHVLIFEKTKK